MFLSPFDPGTQAAERKLVTVPTRSLQQVQHGRQVGVSVLFGLAQQAKDRGAVEPQRRQLRKTE